MASARYARTRRLIKIASLGLAGLIVGLLGGCSASSFRLPSTLWSTDQPAATGQNLTASRRIEDLEDRRIPAFRHAPVPHYTHPAPLATRQTNAAINRSSRTLAAAEYSAALNNPEPTDLSGQ